jgi:general secretion pathway protein L
LQALDAAGCRVTQVVPEFWPQNEVSICVTGTAEEAWITRSDVQGVITFPFRGNDTSGVLDALLADLPASMPILAEPAVVALAESCLTHKVQLRQFDYSLLQSAASRWELAQFEQSLNGDSQGVKNVIRQWQTFWQSPAWRPTRWGLAALLLANIVGLNVWAWQQKNSLNAKRAQMNQLLTQAFPSVKVVVDAPQQMAREMTLLRQAAGASGVQNFESMLYAFSNSNSNLASEFITPSAIEYMANNTTFKGVNLPPNDAISAQTKLKAMGYVLTFNGDTATVKALATP